MIEDCEALTICSRNYFTLSDCVVKTQEYEYSYLAVFTYGALCLPLLLHIELPWFNVLVLKQLDCGNYSYIYYNSWHTYML